MAFYVYTDGATSNNGYANSRGGWAAAVYKDQEIRPLKEMSGHIDNTTNNECEMVAVIMGISMIEFLAQISPIVVVTDSAYIYNCYSQKWYKKWQTNGWLNSKREPVANKELWEEIIPYFEDSRFSFEKTKGHADDARNNYVDKLAVAAKEM